MKLKPLSPKQARSIRQADGRVNIWHGAVRSGKTLASLLWFADQVARHDHSGDILMVAKTERTLRRNTIGPLSDILGYKHVTVRAGAGEAAILGQHVYIVGANDERAEQKIRGGTFKIIYGDELTLWPESFFKMCLTRMSPRGAMLGGTTNPDAPLHWLKTDYIDKAVELGYREFPFGLNDNPELSQEFKDSLAKEFTGLWRKRFVDGLWVLAEGVIWDMFPGEDDALIVKGKLPRMLKFWVGIDYGTVNPFVALLIGLSSPESEPDRRSRLYVCREWRWDSRQRGMQLTDAQYSKKVRRWVRRLGVNPAGWYVDPSAASFILQLHRDGALRVQAADNTVLDGIRSVATLFSNDYLRVHESCETLIHECAGYSWDDAAQERGEDKPLKIDDHGPDALRYPVRMLTPIWQNWVRDLGPLAAKGNENAA